MPWVFFLSSYSGPSSVPALPSADTDSTWLPVAVARDFVKASRVYKNRKMK
jgi:hypothetical protein